MTQQLMGYRLAMWFEGLCNSPYSLFPVLASPGVMPHRFCVVINPPMFIVE